MLIRTSYLNQLIAGKDLGVIKVITGVRRSGKSTLLLQYQDYLRSQGVKNEQILYLNFESGSLFTIKDYRDLYQYVQSHLATTGKTYILLDEVQNISSWEKAVNAFLVDFDCDLYITGSNAYLLSSELTTLLAGRVLTVKLYPFSFGEFVHNHPEKGVANRRDLFAHYQTYGGMPMLSAMSTQPDVAWSYLNDLKDVVLKKDVIYRGKIKDVVFLDNLIKYLSSVVGNLTSPNKIADFMRQNGSTISRDTVDAYLKMLENAYLIYRLPRFALAGKQLLKTQGKYYFVDPGLRNAVGGLTGSESGAALENIVAMELWRRGYELTLGLYQTYEVDFIATKPQETIYFQVTRSLADQNVRAREVRSLLAINDNYRKVILTLDLVPASQEDGVEIINLLDFLLEPAAGGCGPI